MSKFRRMEKIDMGGPLVVIRVIVSKCNLVLKRVVCGPLIFN